jgi:hypothetical protein
MTSKKSKKGISDVVVSVLMILLVIAAIGILWTVLSQFLNRGVNTISSSTLCTSTSLQITPSITVDNESLIKLERVSGSDNLTAIYFYVAGTLYKSTDTRVFMMPGRSTSIKYPAIGETYTYLVNSSTDAAVGQKVEVAAVFGDVTSNPTICPKSGSKTLGQAI